MTAAAANLQQLREFLTVYNTLTENCFNDCINNLNYRHLVPDEEKCATACVDKHMNANHRIMQIFTEIGPSILNHPSLNLPFRRMMDILAEFGFRADGRRANEQRKIRCKLDVYKQADGSAFLQQGNTAVLATVYGPHEARSRHRSRLAHDRAIIVAQFSMTTFSTLERKFAPRGDRKSLELSAQIQRTFESVVRTELYPRTQIDIFCEVLQADGAHLSTCINASTLALIDAGIPLRDFVSAVTVGWSPLSDLPLVDTNYQEENVRLTLGLMPRTDEIVLCELTSRMHAEQLERLMDRAMEGAREVWKVLDKEVREGVGRKAALLGVE